MQNKKHIMIFLKEHSNKYLWLCITLSFVLRMLFAWDNDKMLFADISTYDGFGLNIIEHGVMYNSAYQAPLYTFFLAAIYKTFGHNLLFVYTIQSLLGAGITLLIYLIGANILSKREGLLGAWLSLLYWPLTMYSGILLSEIVFVFLLLSGTYLFLKCLDSNKGLFFFVCGILFSLASLTRSICILFIFLIPLSYFFMSNIHTKKKLANTAIFIIAFSITMSPWVIRNYIIYGAFIPVDTLGGVNLYIGNNEIADGTFVDLSNDPLFTADLNDYEWDKTLKKAAKSFIFSNFPKFVQLTIFRSQLFIFMDFTNFDWVLTRYMEQNYIFRNSLNKWIALMRTSDVIFYILGIAGIIQLAKTKKGLLILGCILYFFSVTSLFYVQFRYRLPIMPFLAISSAASIKSILKNSHLIFKSV